MTFTPIFSTKEGVVKAVNGVSFTLEENSILGLVGGSGSGKTMTTLSILQLIPFPGKIVRGNILYDNTSLLEMNSEQIRRIKVLGDFSDLSGRGGGVEPGHHNRPSSR